MKSTGKVLSREKKTVEAMIGIYCRGNSHEHKKEAGGRCASCGELTRYAHERLDKCVFGEEKPTCAKCPVHCYQPKQKAEITVDALRRTENADAPSFSCHPSFACR